MARRHLTEDQLDLLYRHSGCDSHELFEDTWLGSLTDIENWFGSTPLRPDFYNEKHGATKAAFELAYLSIRLTSNFKFGTEYDSEQRRALEPQFFFATFICALCSSLDEPSRFFSVANNATGELWEPITHGALGAWCAPESIQIGVLDQARQVQRMRTASLIAKAISPSRLAYIGSSVVMDALMVSINPPEIEHPSEHVITRIVRKSQLMQRDLFTKRQRENFSPAAQKEEPILNETKVAHWVAADTDAGQKPTVRPEKKEASITPSLFDAASTVPVSPAKPPVQLSLNSTPESRQVEPYAPAWFDALGDTTKDVLRLLRARVANGSVVGTWQGHLFLVKRPALSKAGVEPEKLIELLREGGLLAGQAEGNLRLKQEVGFFLTGKDPRS